VASLEKRRHQSVADYAAIALCPSLIVLLISSLVYFIVMCVYRGGYSGRIGYIWFMFILGAVGIARLSIEESRKYAFGYSAVLGGATLLVLSQFMTVQGPLAGLTLVINGATIALVWFLADRITYDCTVIDDEEDASGQGLLDGLTDDGGAANDTDQHATRKRGRQPGRTVLWLTAAALPIFGLGQIMLPDDARWQRSAIFALAIYLFAALSLLVATSFLGVRRYLRQRGVDMPANVSTAWLAGGVGMTAIILLVCFLLPQPGKMLASVELPQALESPDWLKPSSYGWGSESAKPEDGQNPASASASAPPQSPEQEPGESGGDQSQSEKSSGEPGGKKQGDKGEGGEKNGGKKKSDGSENGENKSASKSDDPGDGAEKAKDGDTKSQDANQDASEEKSDSSTPSEENESENPPPQDADEASSQELSKGDEEKQSSESQSKDNQADSQSQPPPEPSSPPSSFTNNLPSLSGLLKAIVYLVLIGVLVAFAWIQRDEIAKAWEAFLAWLRGEPASSLETEERISQAAITKTSMPFSAFRNPLGKNGDPKDAVIVTYQAAEAWWREHGQARNPDETPFEFIRRLKPANKADHDAMMRLTEAYNRVVYGDDSVGPPDLAAAAAVWKSFA